jgi:ankyrin repeat protein
MKLVFLFLTIYIIGAAGRCGSSELTDDKNDYLRNSASKNKPPKKLDPVKQAVNDKITKIFDRKIDKKNEQGMLPIHEACANGNLEQLLLCLNADPNKINIKEEVNLNTPLHIAASIGDLEMVKCLYGYGNLTPNSVNKSKRTALWLAVENNNLEVVKFFVSEKTKNGKSISFSKNVKAELIELAQSKGYVNIVEFLGGMPPLNKNVKINKEYETQAQAAEVEFGDIFECCVEKNLRGMEYYIKACGSDDSQANLINSRNNNGDTLLHIAASAGSLDIVRYLYGFKILDSDAENAAGNDDLYLAVSSGNLELVKFIIKAKSRSTNWFIDEHRAKLSSLAEEKGYSDILQFLSTDTPPSAEAILSNTDNNEKPENYDTRYFENFKAKTSSAKSQVLKRAAINKKDNNGNTPLHIAALSGNLEMVRYLYKIDGLVLKHLKNNDSKDPLWIAVEKGDLELVKFFVNEKIKGKQNTMYKCNTLYPKNRKKELIRLAYKLGYSDIEKVLQKAFN